MTRRSLISASLAAAAAGSLKAARLPIRKGVLISMLPKEMSYEDRFKLARDLGFDGIECQTIRSSPEAREIGQASKKAKLPVHSVMNMGHWEWPLNSSDPTVVAKSIEAMNISLQNAADWGAETVLLVPAVVKPDLSYADAITRSKEQIRKLIPRAESLKVVIAVEEVWNKFLLSPIEFAKYVDDFNSPWVKAYFDVGNVVLYGYPQDWIRTLGPRIAKVHLKDFKFAQRKAEFVNLGDGEIDWKAVHAAFAETGYRGFATVELSAGNEAYLTDVSKRVDTILNS